MSTERTYVRAARVFDGQHPEPILDGVVLIENGRIAVVGPFAATSGQLRPTDKGLLFDDATVLPGLIDVHAHVNFGTGWRTYEEVMTSDSDDELFSRAIANCWAHLSCGVTTLRDCGGRGDTTLWLRDAAEQGSFPSPRLLVSGPPLTRTRGHFWWCGGEADGAEEVSGRARELLARGVDFLKIMASGGGTAGTDRRQASYTTAEIGAAVYEAHRVGKLTTAHCIARSSVARAVEAGIDQVEHFDFMRPDGTHEWDARVAETIVRRRIYVSPTIQTGYRQLEALRQRTDLSPAEIRTRDYLEYRFEKRFDFTRRFRALGASLVSGTDAVFVFGDYALGLELMVEAGLAPWEALDSATRTAAEAIGLGADLGTLQVGKVADVAVVQGDPLADIRRMRDVVAVIREGSVVIDKRPEAMAGQLDSAPIAIRSRPSAGGEDKQARVPGRSIRSVGARDGEVLTSGKASHTHRFGQSEP